MGEQPVLLVELERDLGAPVGGWPAELGCRGVSVTADDLGRPAISRDEARAIYAEAREVEVRRARKREELERRLIAADEARRAAMPRGVPVSAEVAGLSAAELMMAFDPLAEESRRESVLEHALAHRDGAIVFHSVEGSASAGGVP